MADFAFCGCANEDYWRTEIPNYDSFIGRKFVDVIHPVAQRGHRVVRETDEYRDLEDKRSDGCATLFGVRKKDGVIAYWRVTPSPESCRFSRKPVTG